MTKMTFGAIGLAAVLTLGLPTIASAHPDRHDYDHAQIDAEHGYVHDQLEQEHADAHEQGSTPWEHEQLHRQLDNQHAEADYAIELQHQRQHARAQWQRRYSRHYGRGYGYRNYNQYQNNYGY